MREFFPRHVQERIKEAQPSGGLTEASNNPGPSGVSASLQDPPRQRSVGPCWSCESFGHLADICPKKTNRYPCTFSSVLSTAFVCMPGVNHSTECTERKVGQSLAMLSFVRETLVLKTVPLLLMLLVTKVSMAQICLRVVSRLSQKIVLIMLMALIVKQVLILQISWILYRY